MGKTNVADLKCGHDDAMGIKVVAIYGCKPPDYAVYRTADRVMIQYADDNLRGDAQRKAMARLNPLRGQINGLLDGWRLGQGAFNIGGVCDRDHAKADQTAKLVPVSILQRKAERYDRRVGDALVVAFEDDVPDAEALLADVKKDILDERIASARFEYLTAAFTGVCVAMLLMVIFTRWHRNGPYPLELWRAAAAGAVGAFFSIALAIRGRTVLPDLQRAGNIMDAVLRVLIGLIAAAALMALVRSGAVTLAIGGASISDPKLAWLYVLIVGFVAGFSERMIPDLLAKVSVQTGAAVGNPPTPKSDDNKQPADPARGAITAQPGSPAAAVPGAASTAPAAGGPPDQEAGIDHCLCDTPLRDDELTHDTELPPATGGVAPAADAQGKAA